MATNEQLEKRLALMKEIGQEQEKIKNLSSDQKTDVAQLAQLFLSQKSSLQNIVRLKDKHAEKLMQQGKDQEAQQIQEQANIARFVLQKLKERETAYKKLAQVARTADKTVTKDAKQNIASIAVDLKSVILSSKMKGFGMMLFEGGEPGSFANHVRAQSQQASREVAQQFQGSGGFAGGPLASVGTAVLGGLGKLVGAVSGAITEELEKNIRQVKTNVTNVIKELDTEYKKYRENVGIDLGSGAYQSFLSAMDVGTSMAKNFNDNPKNKMKFFGDVHIDTQDASAALTTLTNDVSGFSKLMKDPGTAAFGGQLVNQAAAFSRLGIKASATAKIFETASKAQKMNSQEMAKMSRQVVSVGVALDKNLNEVVEDFNKMAPDLVQFGDEMTGVFARLESQSKATGIAAGDLLSTAMRFDTFEGAATAAGRLNAVLGQTAIDTMALIHANPDEKIDMMRKAVTNSLGPFNDLDRRTQSVIANVMGLKGGVQEAQKLFQSDDAYTEYADKVTKGSEATMLSAEKLAELMEGTANVDRLLKTSATSAAHTLNVATFAMQKAAKVVYFGADLLGGLIGKLTPTTGQGSPDVTPIVDEAKLKKGTAVVAAEAKKRSAVQGAPGVTKPTPGPTAPTKIPATAARAATKSHVKQMASNARDLRKALSPIPKAIDKIADSLMALASGKSGNALKLLGQAIPADLSEMQRQLTLATPSQKNELIGMTDKLHSLFPSIKEAMSMTRDSGSNSDLRAYFEKKAEYEAGVEKQLSEVLGTRAVEAIKTMPAQMSTQYREHVSETKSLDTTKYLENYTTIVKEQNTSTKELAEKMDKLIEVLGGKDKSEQPLKLVGPISLQIGNSAQIDTVIKESLDRLKLRL